MSNSRQIDAGAKIAFKNVTSRTDAANPAAGDKGTIYFCNDGSIMVNGKVFAENNTIDIIKVNGEEVLTNIDESDSENNIANITINTSLDIDGAIDVQGSPVSVRGFSNLKNTVTSVTSQVEAIQNALYAKTVSGTFNALRMQSGKIVFTTSLKFGNTTIPRVGTDAYTVEYRDGANNVVQTTYNQSDEKDTTVNSVTLSNQGTPYSAKITYKGQVFIIQFVVKAYYPIKCGFAKLASDGTLSLTDAHVITYTTPYSSSRRTYTITAEKEGRWFLAVPVDDVVQPTSHTTFSMGSTPVSMAPVKTQNINGVNYKIYYTNSNYSVGASLEIKVG